MTVFNVAVCVVQSYNIAEYVAYRLYTIYLGANIPYFQLGSLRPKLQKCVSVCDSRI